MKKIELEGNEVWIKGSPGQRGIGDVNTLITR